MMVADIYYENVQRIVHSVLILIVMDDGRRRLLEVVTATPNPVLILIVMDDGRRPGNLLAIKAKRNES